MPFDCGTSTIEADDNLGGIGFPINCNCWRCPACAPRNQRRVKRWIAAGRPDRFITLSCREGAFGDPVIAAQKQRAAFNLVVHRWRRLKPTNECEYAVICEEHENGYPHLHIAWKGGWIDQGWLSRQMAELMDSPIVDIRRIYSYRGAVNYLTKYMAKGLYQFGTLKRFWFSQGYPRTKRERLRLHRFKLEKGHHRNRSFDEMIADWVRQNKTVQYLQQGGAAWGHWWKTGPPVDPAPNGYWRYRRGFPHFKTKQGWGW